MKEPAIVFDEAFLETEERSGYVVDKVMKHAWAAELEVLCEIDRICKKHNIRWYAYYGTMLGAVRHQGFIPWDDDLDIAMLREDYEKFLRVLPKELGEEFCFYAGRMDGNTGEEVFSAVATGVSMSFTEEHLHRFHNCPYAVGCDVFPIDYLPREEKEQNVVKSLLRIIEKLYSSKDRTWKKDLRTLEELMNVTFKRDETLKRQLVEYYDRICSMYRPEECDDMVVYAFWIADREKEMKKEWFEEMVYLPFENLRLPVPKHYDEILTALYGDYMVPVKGAANHDYPVFKKQQKDFEKYARAQGVRIDGLEEICWKLTEEDWKEEKELCETVHKYYVLTGGEQSGWAESLCFELQQSGCESKVCLADGRKECDDPEAVVVVHGSMAGMTDDLCACRRVIWWVSKREMEEYFRKENCKEDIFMHVVTSSYLEGELRKLVELPEEKVYKVAPYLLEMAPEKRIAGAYRESLVLYDEEGAGYVEPLAELMNWIQWAPVNAYDPEQRRMLMSVAKVYIGWGENTCVSEYMQQAVSCGCCVITNQKGCAGYEEDIPIDEKYRFANVQEQYVEVAELIQNICENYDAYESDFNQFRYAVAEGGELFTQDILELVRLLEEEEVEEKLC